MKTPKTSLIDFAVNRSKWVAFGLLAIMVFFAMFFPNMTMDTDPENMLEPTEPVRVFHNAAKKRFDLSDTIVVGVIKDNDPHGVFNPRTLAHVFELTRFAKTLRYEDPKHPGKTTGVIEVDMVAPSMVDHMRQAGPGTIAFEWLMRRPPTTEAEALAVRDKALSNPLLVGQMVSADGKALCLYLPLTDKLLSYDVYTALREKIREFGDAEDWHIAGLPVAEGAIGVEMFSEMVIASPLAMVLIFGMLYAMFRRWSMVILPMLIATATVVATLGAMIALGLPVHILSSMLPIFLMSISICDAIHVLSEFFDVYTAEKGRKESIKEVMNTLFMPMFYTSLTTAAGFFSFVTTDIPPARVFGAFVGVGVMFAWIITILFVPAYIMLLPERTLRDFGMAAHRGGAGFLADAAAASFGGNRLPALKGGSGRVPGLHRPFRLGHVADCHQRQLCQAVCRGPSHSRGGHGAQQAFRRHVYGVAGFGCKKGGRGLQAAGRPQLHGGHADLAGKEPIHRQKHVPGRHRAQGAPGTR